MEKNKVEESRGVHHFKRIGRPDCWYDNRTNYKVDHEEFDKNMKERKSLGSSLIEETDSTIENSLEYI